MTGACDTAQSLGNVCHEMEEREEIERQNQAMINYFNEESSIVYNDIMQAIINEPANAEACEEIL